MASPLPRSGGRGPSGECRAVAPLLARYGDPDLTEAERILLSTHLPRCPECWARLQTYRWQDWRLRRLPGVTLDPRVRCAVFDQLAAASRPPLRFAALRHGLSSLAVVAVATLVFSSALLLRPSAVDRPATASSGAAGVGGAAHSLSAAGEFLAQPLTATFLSTSATRTITAVGASAGITGAANAARPTPADTAVTGSVRALYSLDGRLLLSLTHDGREQTLTLARDTPVRLANGRPGTLADLTVGTSVRVYVFSTGAVREIVVTR